MPRKRGSKNANHQQKRIKLLQAIVSILLEKGAGLSFREIAEHTLVSVSTLRHYFEDRESLLKSVWQHLHEEGKPFMDLATVPQGQNAQESIQSFLSGFLMAWEAFEVGRIHMLGLAEGLGHKEMGPAYVNEMLEPTLQSAEKLLLALEKRGDICVIEKRGAAISLIAPLFLALLHQGALFGKKCRPLNIQDFLSEHSKRWLLGHMPKQ